MADPIQRQPIADSSLFTEFFRHVSDFSAKRVRRPRYAIMSSDVYLRLRWEFQRSLSLIQDDVVFDSSMEVTRIGGIEVVVIPEFNGRIVMVGHPEEESIRG